MYKVLIVEDEFVLREGLKYALDWHELECIIVASAVDGIDGLEKIKTYQPDIVITDINMPKMDGLKMIDQSMSDYVYSAIITTGYADVDYMKQSIHYGVCEYILKPIDENELKNAVVKAIQQVKEKAYYQEMLQVQKNTQEINLLKCIPTRFDSITTQVIGFIHQKYASKITMQTLVENLHYSESILNKRFKESTGHTINDYLNRYRIQQVIVLIKKGESIQDASFKAGFIDFKYFNIVFKKYIGYAPKEFMKLLDIG